MWDTFLSAHIININILLDSMRPNDIHSMSILTLLNLLILGPYKPLCWDLIYSAVNGLIYSVTSPHIPCASLACLASVLLPAPWSKGRTKWSFVGTGAGNPVLYLFGRNYVLNFNIYTYIHTYRQTYIHVFKYMCIYFNKATRTICSLLRIIHKWILILVPCSIEVWIVNSRC